MMQRLKRLLHNDSGVSSVIGVVLMVGVTVVLASTVGTFVLDIGQNLNDPTPTAIFAADQDKQTYSDGSDTAKLTEVELIYRGGDRIDPSRVRVLVDSEPAYARGEAATYSGDDVYQIAQPFGGVDMITAGVTASIWTKTDTYGTAYWTEDRSSNNDPYFSVSGSSDHIAMDTHNSDTDPSPAADLGLESGELVRVVYDSPEGSKYILYEYEVE